MIKKRIPILTAILAIIIIVCVGATGYIKASEAKLKQLAVQTISDINFSEIPDGIYTGSFKSFPVAAEVKVAVKEHKITAIDLVKHKNGQGKAAEIILDRVIEAQKLDVDIISGATYSSKVILRAIENALNSAVK